MITRLFSWFFTLRTFFLYTFPVYTGVKSVVAGGFPMGFIVGTCWLCGLHLLARRVRRVRGLP